MTEQKSPSALEADKVMTEKGSSLEAEKTTHPGLVPDDDFVFTTPAGCDDMGCQGADPSWVGSANGWNEWVGNDHGIAWGTEPQTWNNEFGVNNMDHPAEVFPLNRKPEWQRDRLQYNRGSLWEHSDAMPGTCGGNSYDCTSRGWVVSGWYKQCGQEPPCTSGWKVRCAKCPAGNPAVPVPMPAPAAFPTLWSEPPTTPTPVPVPTTPAAAPIMPTDAPLYVGVYDPQAVNRSTLALASAQNDL